jgi:sugar lactone lactonase YvrE
VLITMGKRDGWAFGGELARNQLLRLNDCSAEAIEWARGSISYEPCSSGQPVILNLHNYLHEWGATTTTRVVRFFKEHALPTPPPAPGQPFTPDASLAVVGTGQAGQGGGPASTARLFFPGAVALDGTGQLYIADTGNHQIRRVGSDGIITKVAGINAVGFFQGEGVATRNGLFYPEGIALDRDGNLFIADTYDRLVLKVTPRGTISKAVAPAFAFPSGLALDREGNLFIAETEGHRVFRSGPGGLVRIAGTGRAGFSGDGGDATEAQLHAPWGLAVDGEGALYIADSGNHCVRKVARDGKITTVAGTGTRGLSGDEGPATAARLNQPLGLAVDSQKSLFIVDSHNHRVRRVAPQGTITTVFGGGAGDGGAAPTSSAYSPAGIAIDRSGNLLIADSFHHRVWKLSGVAAPGLLAGQPFPEPNPP